MKLISSIAQSSAVPMFKISVSMRYVNFANKYLNAKVCVSPNTGFPGRYGVINKSMIKTKPFQKEVKFEKVPGNKILVPLDAPVHAV